MDISQQKVWNPKFEQFSQLFFPIMAYGAPFSKYPEWPTVDDLNRHRPLHVQSFLSHDIHFVLQKSIRRRKEFSCLYEPRIFLQGEVNTRAHSWHDFFNALIWYAFPKTKAALNMRQFIAFDERASFPWNCPPLTRTREQDRMTMFDEGGCILLNLLNPQGNSEKKLPLLFGHGFYERMAYGDSDLSACTLDIDIEFPYSPKQILGQTSKIFLKQLLKLVDDRVSCLLSRREFYQQDKCFYPCPLSDFEAIQKLAMRHEHSVTLTNSMEL